MYLSKLKLWNFRKYGESDLANDPALIVELKDGLNVLIGENDSGKTAIIDAIRIILGTQSNEYCFIDENDFYCETKELKIECIFKFKDKLNKKASKFLEWIVFDENKNPELKVRLVAKIGENGRINKTITAGNPDLDNYFDALDELRVTYLKPLRNANVELIAGRSSRLAQILKNHKLFEEPEDHPLIGYINEANKNINNYFQNPPEEIEDPKVGDGSKISKVIGGHLEAFMGKELKDDYNLNISISDKSLNSILYSLNLKLSENKVGLGTLNQLYMALELLLFEKNSTSEETVNLCLIEELEAHLHPQAQIRIIKHLQNYLMNGQIILSTHSITLGASIELENLIICKDNKTYPMGKNYTMLEDEDYEFLERFLDATKANLFFSKGVLFVEGDAENLLIPTIAELLDRPLHEHGISIVNIGNTAFNRYSKIFLRQQSKEKFNIPVAILTDLDIKEDGNKYSIVRINDCLEKLKEKYTHKGWDIEAIENREFENIEICCDYLKNISSKKRLENGMKKQIEENIIPKIVDIDQYREIIREKRLKSYNKGCVKAFINKSWTLEYDLACSGIREYLYLAILQAQGKKEDIESVRSTITQWEKAKINPAEKIFIDNFYTDIDKNQKAKLSKAIVAQYLAKILKENREEVKPIIEKDNYLSYIKEAIYFVTKPTIKKSKKRRRKKVIS